MQLQNLRAIGYDWHGGKSSAMYSFASTGWVHDREGLLDEIDENLEYLNELISTGNTMELEEAAREIPRLQLLRDYVEENYEEEESDD